MWGGGGGGMGGSMQSMVNGVSMVYIYIGDSQ